MGDRIIADESQEIAEYQKYLLKSVESFFGSDRTNRLQQEDNIPRPHIKLSIALKLQNNVTTIECPVMSPDANLMENVWWFIKMKINPLNSDF